MDQGITISQAASFLNITRQGVYIAIKSGRLKGKKEGGKWYIQVRDISQYVYDKYSRRLTKKNDGSLLYNPAKGEYSVTQIAEMAGCGQQRIYYLIRTEQLKAIRHRSAYIIQLDDVSDMPNFIGSLFRQK